jgi:hypothetical protein
MSMIGNFVAISPGQLATLVADPDLMESFLYPDDGEAEPENHLDVDKAWHAIHYMLNGKTWEGDPPLFWTVMGGKEIGEDVGYGPARYLSVEQVKAIAGALSAIDAKLFGARFDARALDAAEIYPQIWESGDAEALEYVVSYYDQLRSFYLAAAERGDAVLIYLN